MYPNLAHLTPCACQPVLGHLASHSQGVMALSHNSRALQTRDKIGRGTGAEVHLDRLT
jgi:hypothetical protein